MAATYVTGGITTAFGQRLEAIVRSVKAIDDGHRFRLAYLIRKHRDAQMHNGVTFALDVVRERYLRPGTENLGSPEFTELLELYKDRVYDAHIASDAKPTSRQRFGGVFRRHDRDRDGGTRAMPATRSTATLLYLPGITFVLHMVSSPTYFIPDAEAKASLSELMRGSNVEALYGTKDEWGAKCSTS
eukprot:jgi/Tetstr1/420437/TSEL_011551.t1